MSLTLKGISHVNFSKTVTINTQFTIAAVTLELRTVQQLQGQLTLHYYS